MPQFDELLRQCPVPHDQCVTEKVHNEGFFRGVKCITVCQYLDGFFLTWPFLTWASYEAQQFSTVY